MRVVGCGLWCKGEGWCMLQKCGKGLKRPPRSLAKKGANTSSRFRYH